MIVELRDKFARSQAQVTETPVASNGSQLLHDAVSALVNLGYRKAEVEKNVSDTIHAERTALEEVIKEVAAPDQSVIWKVD